MPDTRPSDVIVAVVQVKVDAMFAVRLMAVGVPLQRVTEVPVEKLTRGTGLTVTVVLSGLPTQPSKEVGVIL